MVAIGSRTHPVKRLRPLNHKSSLCRTGWRTGSVSDGAEVSKLTSVGKSIWCFTLREQPVAHLREPSWRLAGSGPLSERRLL